MAAYSVGAIASAEILREARVSTSVKPIIKSLLDL